MHDTYVYGGSYHARDNIVKILLKVVRGEDAVIGLRWVNVFALFRTDRKNG